MTAQLREYQGGAVPTQLGSAITAVSTVLTINATGGWPTGTVGPFGIVIDPSTATEEHIQCSLRAGGSLTVLNRGWDGTVATGHAAGAVVKHIWGGDDATTVNKHAADPTQNDHTQYVLQPTWQSWVPVVSANGAMVVTITPYTARYMLRGKLCIVNYNATIALSGTPQNTFQISLPIALSPSTLNVTCMAEVENTVSRGRLLGSLMNFYRFDVANFTCDGGLRNWSFALSYETI